MIDVDAIADEQRRAGDRLLAGLTAEVTGEPAAGR